MPGCPARGTDDRETRDDEADVDGAPLIPRLARPEVGTVQWVLGAAALVVVALGLVLYRLPRRDDDRQAAAIVSFIVGADLLVLAVNAALA